MGEQFIIQVPYAIITNPNNHLESVNQQIAAHLTHGKQKLLQFEVLYSLGINKETGLTRIEGKLKTEDNRLDIECCELPCRLPYAVISGETTHPRYIPLFTISQCIENVLGWSAERGILDNGKWETQITKFYEEDGEAATGISKTKERLIMDGLGDALVVLTNVVALIDNMPNSIDVMLTRARSKISIAIPVGDAHRIFHKMRLNFTLMYDVIYQASDRHQGTKRTTMMDNVESIRFEEYMLDALWYMEALAHGYGMTLEECFSLAWDEIKDRKGFLNADGIFIKEADA